MTDAERLKTLEMIIDQGPRSPSAELEKLSIGSQLSLEARMRSELEDLAGALGPEGLGVVIGHLEGLLGELISGGVPSEMIVDMKGTIERLRLRRADYN